MTQTLEHFGATHAWEDIDSSFVDAVWHNYYTGLTLVRLVDDNGEERYYLYDNLTVDGIREWMQAVSKGHYYNTVIKRDYGPSEAVEEPVLIRPLWWSETSKGAEPAKGPVTLDTQDEDAPLYEYTLEWGWDGNSLPDYTVKAANDNEAVKSLTESVASLRIPNVEIFSVSRKVGKVTGNE